LLILLITSLTLLGVSEMASAACPPPKDPTCDPDFTGRSARCVNPAQGGCQGERGPRGPRGRDGKRGATGKTGDRGITGKRGVRGVAGAIGAVGEAGIQGATGATGADGARGIAGADGQDGTAGTDGTDGTDGQDGTDAIAGYAYVYNTGFQAVPLETSINFSNNGALTAGFSHVPGASGLVIADPGSYLVSFSATTIEANQMAVFLDGVVVPQSIYGSASGSQQNDGQVVITTATPNTSLTIRNHTSAAAVTLHRFAGGTADNVNASITIQALG
jgi:hypothetical protein